MLDRFATETAGHANGFPGPTFVSRSWPERVDGMAPIDRISSRLLGTGEFLFAMHKDDVCADDFAVYAAILGRATVAFANEVYVLFHVRAAEHDRNDVKSLYIRAAEARSSIPQTQPRNGHFCTYIGNNTLLTETYFGRKIYIDSSDISVTPHIAYEGRWEQHVTEFVIQNLRPGDIFVDIGANCGFFTVLASHVVGPAGFVLAIEPQKGLADLIRKTLLINGFDAFAKVKNLAVAAERGEMKLSHAADYLGSASLISFGTQETKVDTVQVEPLDDVISRLEVEIGRTVRPRMIKIDVEGFEPSVWHGSRSVLRRSPLTVILEFSPDKYRQIGIDPADFLDEIVATGFTVHELASDGRAIRVGAKQRTEIMTKPDFTDLVLTK
jgi:FkbM family methyltransferase